MDLTTKQQIELKIWFLKDAGVTTEYLKELTLLVNEGRAEDLANYKGAVLERLGIDENRPPIGSVSFEKIIKAMNAAGKE